MSMGLVYRDGHPGGMDGKKDAMKIELSIQEVELCEFIGMQRSAIARSNGVVDTKMGDHDGVKADIQGFKAEYAFAKYGNLFPDPGLSPRSGSYDGITHQGGRYDIKSTHHKNGNLLSTLKVNPDIDIYVLAVVQDNIVDLIGWAKKEDLIKPENIKDMGHGKGYFLSREKLNKL
tara:strand:+ start:443 stop:967 length:525 start_codon:yes stop_codon:yes gene_type:complete